jgi:nicotinamidase-related amidase
MRLRRQASAVILVDAQEKLVSAMAEPDSVLGRAELVLRVANRLGLPVLATEHCPGSLGPTLAPLARHIPAGSRVEKRHFDGAAEPGVLERVRALGRPTLALLGREAHVCLMQTALGLKQAGFAVAVIADAVASRNPADRTLALARLARNGIEVVSAEMAIFEWLEAAGTPEFREILPWIK